MYVKTDLTVKGLQSSYEYAALSVSPNGLSSIVQSGDIISKINQSAERVSIQANKIDLSGNLHLKGDFVADSAIISGVSAYMKDGDLGLVLDNKEIGKWTYNTTSEQSIYYANSAITLNSFALDTGIAGTSSEVGALASHLHRVVVDNGFWVNSLTNPSDICATIYGGASFRQVCYFQGNVYNSGGGVVFVSDQRKKKNIKDLAIEKAKSFIMALKPREFKFKKGISTSNRKHHGFIAQEVQEAMHEDWGVYINDKEKDFIGLRYDELIADMVAVIQDQEKRIQALERKLEK